MTCFHFSSVRSRHCLRKNASNRSGSHPFWKAVLKENPWLGRGKLHSSPPWPHHLHLHLKLLSVLSHFWSRFLKESILLHFLWATGITELCRSHSDSMRTWLYMHIGHVLEGAEEHAKGTIWGSRYRYGGNRKISGHLRLLTSKWRMHLLHTMPQQLSFGPQISFLTDREDLHLYTDFSGVQLSKQDHVLPWISVVCQGCWVFYKHRVPSSSQYPWGVITAVYIEHSWTSSKIWWLGQHHYQLAKS